MAAWSDPEFTHALEDARKGHGDRWLAMLRPTMLAWVQRDFPRWLRPRLDPEDVVQEAQLGLFAGLGRVRTGDPVVLESWVQRVTRTALQGEIRFHSRGRRDVHGEVPLALEPPDPWAGSWWDALVLTEALRELSEGERRVVRLHHVEGRPWHATSRRLALSPWRCRELDRAARGKLTCLLAG